jgi:hypothetical protein
MGSNNSTKGSVPFSAFRLILVSCALLGGCAAFSPADAFAAEEARPTINDVTTTKVYEHEGTIEAQINPQGSETTYEIWLECESIDALPCEPIGSGQRIQGQLASGFEAKTVSLLLNNLQPGSRYWYGIAATNSVGETESRGNILVVGVIPPGACPTGCGTGEQYGSEVPGWYTGLSNSESAETLKEYEAKHAKELEAAHAKEEEEQRAREAAKVAEAAALKRRQEEEAEMATGGVMLASTNITMMNGRISLVKLECLGSSACSGRLVLVGKLSTTSKGKRHNHKATIGTVSFSIPGDDATAVKVDINAAGRMLLRTARGHLSASLTIEELPATADSTQTKTVHLAPERSPH